MNRCELCIEFAIILLQMTASQLLIRCWLVQSLFFRCYRIEMNVNIDYCRKWHWIYPTIKMSIPNGTRILQIVWIEIKFRHFCQFPTQLIHSKIASVWWIKITKNDKGREKKAISIIWSVVRKIETAGLRFLSAGRKIYYVKNKAIIATWKWIVFDWKIDIERKLPFPFLAVFCGFIKLETSAVHKNHVNLMKNKNKKKCSFFV